MSVHSTYCRICQAACGVLADVRDNRIVRITGDRDNPMSRGFTCPKGRRGGDLLAGPERLTQSQARNASGAFEPIAAEDAAQRIAGQLQAIIAEHGPDAVGVFMGTQSVFATLTRPMGRAWFAATGSRKFFATMTIDQSAKWVAAARMGEYLGGRQSFGEADVWVLAGTNPLVSVNGGAGDGVLMQNPSVELAEARKRGMKLVVIDPRRTESAFQADIHLSPRPGCDALIFAGMLNLILSERLYDREFCARHANGLADLAAAVAEATPERVARIADIPREDFVAATRLFAAGPRGRIFTGTGVCMGRHSNLAEHLATCLNVVCGRFQREGDLATGNAVLGADVAPRAEVAPPDRTWERGYQTRLGAGLLRGEVPTNTMCDEILAPGADRLRALVVWGGNPVVALPDSDKALRALSSLDLLVTIDTRMSETARIADYVIAPTMTYERADNTVNLEPYFAHPYAMATEAIVAPPPGVIEDWQFFWLLGKAMGKQMTLAGRDLDMEVMPRSADLLALLAAHGRVPLAEVAAAPHGFAAPPRKTRVAPAREEARCNRLELLPGDVHAELESMLAEASEPPEGEFRLAVRRMRELMNSLGREIDRLPRQPFNPAFLNPSEMERLDLAEDSPVRISSAHGSVLAQARSDETVRPGVVAMTHCWSPLFGSRDARNDSGKAVNINLLTSGDEVVQSINRMPLLTSFAVRVERCA